jgi:proline-specific peptidase
MRMPLGSNKGEYHETMWGPNEFEAIGNLKNWDRTDRLIEITVPTLITVGRYDVTTSTCAETLHRGILNSRTVIFKESAHLAHLEEIDRYLQVVADFMGKNETPKL